MKILARFIIILLIVGCSCSPKIRAKTIDPFPTEQEVNSFLKVGLDKKDVIKKFGEPQTKTLHPKGLPADEIYCYYKPPSFPLKEEFFVYNGFQISFIKGKVSDFSIIHATFHASSPK